MQALRLLTVAELAAELRCCVRTARRWASAWCHLAARHVVPRVRIVRTGRRGHPAYLIDAASLAAWLRRAFLGAPSNTNAVAND